MNDCKNGCKNRGYCERFLHTLIKCFSLLANITKPLPFYDFTLHPPLTKEKHIISQYLRAILATYLDDKISPVTISKYSIYP